MNFKIDSIQILITKDGIKPIGQSKMTNDVFVKKNFKIYIIKSEALFLYIGKTSQQIGTKLGQGFRAYKNDLEKGERQSGYGGYKWVDKYMDKKLSLYVVDLGKEVIDEYAEAVEAEIVFQIRQRYNRWPECQNEIHFNNEHTTASLDALEILDLIK